ncbi:MAG: hypothetical protein VX416_14715, partial [Pseudomonadota bacterium]|nr:hypothetical protein [Pseudomonadota bacterium]
MVKDPCILAVLDGWDAIDARVVTPAPTKAILWEEDFSATEAPVEESTTEMTTTTEKTTTTTTTNSSWWRDAVSHLPRILRNFPTVPPRSTTTTTTPSPEARRNAPWPPANALPFSRRFPANVPADARSPDDAAATPVDADSSTIIPPTPSTVDAEDNDVENRHNGETAPKTIDGVSTVLPPSSNTRLDAGDDRVVVKVEPQAAVATPPLPSAPQTAVATPPLPSADEPAPEVKVEPVSVNETPIIPPTSSIAHADDDVR